MKLSNLLFQPDVRASASPGHASIAPMQASIDPSHAGPAAQSGIRDDLATARQHHPFTRMLHWTTFVLLIVAAGAICARAYIGDRATARLLLAVHESAGLTVLALTLVRLAWRAYAQVGRLHAALPLRQRVAAAIGHHAIHATTLALAVLGWLTSNAFGLPLRLLGLLPLPVLIARDRDLGDVLQDWHAGAAWVLLALVAGHVAAALWHHCIRRDGVLRSMQPLRSGSMLRGAGNRRIATPAICTLALIGAALLSTPARAAANDAGADLYDQECADCHSLAKPLRNKTGPSLVGIVDKAAAGVPGFAYSDALKAARIAWTKDALDAYIANPKKVVRGGGKMKYDGLDEPEARAAIIDFLSHRQ